MSSILRDGVNEADLFRRARIDFPHAELSSAWVSTIFVYFLLSYVFLLYLDSNRWIDDFILPHLKQLAQLIARHLAVS